MIINNMDIIFEELFTQASQRKIKYKDQYIYAVDVLLLPANSSFELSFNSVSSKLEQGINIQSEDRVEINGQQSKKFLVWQKTSPETFMVENKTNKDVVIYVNNQCKYDNESDLFGLTMNCAMKVENISDAERKYLCNDAEKDEDFDDLIFIIKSKNKLVSLVEEQPEKYNKW